MERKVKEETKAVAESSKKDKQLDDAEMVIEASEELEVVKSFDELGIREELIRGKQNRHLLIFYRNILLWLQQAICSPAASHSPNRKKERCDCSEPEWYW